MTRLSTFRAFLVCGIYLSTSPIAEVGLERTPDSVDLSPLWVAPADIAPQDLFYGPGAASARPIRERSATRCAL